MWEFLYLGMKGMLKLSMTDGRNSRITLVTPPHGKTSI